MAYEAIIVKLKNVRPHPNADRVQLATACNTQVIVGIDNTENQLGVFFADDGCLSEEMTRNNNLYANKEMNLDPTKSGYFKNNRHIKAQNFRGERSDGFWTDLQSLAWTGLDLSQLNEGFTFTSLNGKEVCKKYINPGTLQNTQNKMRKVKKSNTLRRFIQLKEHFDTKQLRREISRIPNNSVLYLTEKCHGTSGRTGNVYIEGTLSKRKILWNKYFRWLKIYKPEKYYQIVSGTRRVILNPDEMEDKGYYSGKTFRIDIHNNLVNLGLPKGLTLYYEVCGFDEQGKPIMSSQSTNKVDDKKLRKFIEKKYGKLVVFSYGCHHDDPIPYNRYKVLVYRATITSQDGNIFELSWPQVRQISNTLGLDTVPDLAGPLFYDSSEAGQENLLKLIDKILDLDSAIDSRHVMEGICIRVEAPNGEIYILKDKGYIFRVLEGILKSDPNVIDIEEVEDNQEHDLT